jgi:AraC-like DNA-binding protein
MTGIAILITGYSLLSGLSLVFTHFFTEQYTERALSRVMGLVMLCALGILQAMHFTWLYWDVFLLESTVYFFALFTVAPAFYMFCQHLLSTNVEPVFRPQLLLHLLPLVFCWWIPTPFRLPLAFVLGAGYLLWLGKRLFDLRAERTQFRLEIFVLGAVFIIAIAVSILGFFQALLPHKLFYSLYASAIGLAFFGVHLILGLRPSLANDVRETAESASYANSTLHHLDCDVLVARLTVLFDQENIYKETGITLPLVAGRLGISAHQLSELLNVRLGKGFSRFLREARIEAAKIVLRDEPSASVLSVGLSVGFTSQSNFYEAFREIEGMTPGQYRKVLPPPKQ